jgi:uncharacterized repeat protein (TIGR03803 family)
MTRSTSSCLLALLVVLASVMLASTSASAAATEHILYGFNPAAHGYQPNGGLISDAAGNLYGVTAWGGAFDLGSVYELMSNLHGGWTVKVLYSFKGNRDIYSPNGTLTFDAAGNLYGAAIGGGPSNGGGVYKLTPNSTGPWTETVLHSFAIQSEAFNPYGGLAFDHAGNLYGAANYVVFKLAPGSNGQWTESTAFRFPKGNYPDGNLIFDQTGNLYGTTRGGCSSSYCGNVFKLTPSSGSWIGTVLYAFTGGPDGADPNGGVIFDQAGNLYGATGYGGSGTACYGGCGVIFKLTPTSSGPWTETLLYNFQGGSDADSPSGNLIFDQAGNLYGSTPYGPIGSSILGTAFKLTPGSNAQWTLNLLWSFTAGADGAIPQAGVALGSQGQIYVAAQKDGRFGHGTVIQLTPSASGLWNETTVTDFPYTDGGWPQTNLITDAAGNFYGTTTIGGAYGNGTAFKLTKSSSGTWQETTLYNFKNGLATQVGAAPSALIFDSAGNLYGETAYDGPDNRGTIFELSPNPSGWTAKTLHSFKGADGIRPFGGLVFDQAGNLYGTTQGGGGNTGCGFGCGTVFELTPASGGQWTQTVLYRFTPGSDGLAPVAGLVFDAAGNLYGTTPYGGQTNNGTVFKLSPGSGGWTETVLYRFTDAHGDGRTPMARLIFDPAGSLYGTTIAGGARGLTCRNLCGTVFELSPNSSGAWSETVLLAFNGTDGAGPVAGLILDPSGNLYGTTQNSVFELSPQPGGGWKETVLHIFPAPFSAGHDGYLAEASVILDQSGDVFGTALGGGPHNGGIVFEITP